MKPFLGWSTRLRARLMDARWLWAPLLAFSLTRLGLALVAYVSAPLIADSAVPPYHIRPDHTLLDVFGSRWDTGFYLSIAEQGYQYPAAPFSSVAFFPLLPLFIRAFKLLTGDALVAGLAVTNLALLGAMVLLYRLVEQEWGDTLAERTVWYVLIFPTSLFGSAIYSESLFLLGSIGALYFARAGKWGVAALWGVLASLSRLAGLLVAPLLLVEWWTQRRQRAAARPRLVTLLAPAAVLLGAGIYMLYLYLTFGDPLAFVRASGAWGREMRSPLAMIGELVTRPAQGWGAAVRAGQLPLDNWIDLGAVLLFVALGGVLLVQRRWAEGVFVVAGSLMPLGSGLLMSQRRYVWVLFPAFILLARWGQRPWLDRAITGISFLGLGLFTALFANWYWVG